MHAHEVVYGIGVHGVDGEWGNDRARRDGEVLGGAREYVHTATLTERVCAAAKGEREQWHWSEESATS